MNTPVKTTKVYDEIIDFIAAGTTPQSVVNFQLSEAAKERLEDLVYRAKTEGLTGDDKRELDHFLTLEHIMTLAKARAYQYISAEQVNKVSRPYIKVELRRLVMERAGDICEYCLISAVDRSSGCQVDHIISVKHGGATTADNLCYACVR